jgi:hypothetical protein
VLVVSKETKVRIVEDLNSLVSRSSIAILADYRGIPAVEMSNLRRRLREQGIDFKVVKNTLARLAVGKAGRDDLFILFKGPVAVAFGYYENWGKNSRRVANFGFAWMIVALMGALVIYVVSGVGNYQIPSFFVNGANGVAGDDMTTGVVGLGAVFVLAGLISHSRGSLTGEGRPLYKDPLFLSVVVAWITIYLVIPVTGFYINFNENFFKFAGINFDDAFNRYHQDFGFYLLPSLVTLLITLQTFGIGARARKYVGYFTISGILMAFVFGETYTLSAASYTTPYVGQVYTVLPMASVFLDLAVLGGVLIAVGGLLAVANFRASQAKSL